MENMWPASQLVAFGDACAEANLSCGACQHPTYQHDDGHGACGMCDCPDMTLLAVDPSTARQPFPTWDPVLGHAFGRTAEAWAHRIADTADLQ